MIFSTLEDILATDFEAAIFDFDGTIAHTHHIWKLVDQEFFESRGIPYTPEIGKILSPLGFEKGAEWAIATYGLKEDPEEIVAEWKELSKSFFVNSVQLRPGVVDFIGKLQEKDIPTALATVNEPELLALLEPRLHLSTLFDTQVFAADVGSAKGASESQPVLRTNSSTSSGRVYDESSAETTTSSSMPASVPSSASTTTPYLCA